MKIVNTYSSLAYVFNKYVVYFYYFPIMLNKIKNTRQDVKICQVFVILFYINTNQYKDFKKSITCLF